MVAEKQKTKTELRTRTELRRLLAECYQIRYSVSQQLARDELQALVDALESQSPLSVAIRAIIEERNAKAKNNSQLGLNNYQLGNKLIDTRKKLSYVERQLEDYKRLARELLRDLLRFETSEIYQGIRIILNALR
ncbi:hypothetical protein [Leptothermofonsia sp. ETS-13]|uniref:hypothetical protein n=1 Tax=Leptothermofonsia sp. ETS-13 TaxID=3035696 RepID=UPI003BA00663